MRKAVLFLYILFLPFTYYSQQGAIDSLRALLKTAAPDTSKINWLNQLSEKHTDATQFDTALSYARQALQLSEKKGFVPGIARSNISLGRANWKKGEIELALPFYFNGEKIYRALGDQRGLAKTQATIGLVYTYHHRYPQSMEYLYKALRIYEALGDSESIAKSHVNLGFSYLSQYNGPKAKKFFRIALTEFKRLGNAGAQAQILLNMGTMYMEPLRDSALIFNQLALDLANSAHDLKNVASATINIGVVYRHKGEIKKALEYLEKGLQLKTRLNDKEGVAAALMDIGAIYKTQHRDDKAMEYFLKGAVLAKEMKSWKYISFANHHLSELYAKRKDFEKAFAAHVEKANAVDSMFNQKSAKRALQAEMDFNYEKRELALKAETEKKEAIYKEESRQQRIIIIAAMAVLILMLIITFLLLRQVTYRNEQRETLLEHKMLRSQMNPHFIFNSLQAIQNFILRNESMDAARYLSSFAKITRSVLEGSRMELISVEKELDLLNNYLQLQKLRFGDRFDYHIRVEPGMSTSILIPPMLSQPFIENALEHGMKDIESGGLIEVCMAVRDNRFILEIQDNGSGMAKTTRVGGLHQSLATAITRERIELLNRRQAAKTIFTIEEAWPDKIRKGVKVSFSLPLSHLEPENSVSG